MSAETYLGAAGKGHDVAVRLLLQALPIVLAQQHDAMPQKARHVREELQVEEQLTAGCIAGHAVRCMHAHHPGLHAERPIGRWGTECTKQDEHASGWSDVLKVLCQCAPAAKHATELALLRHSGLIRGQASACITSEQHLRPKPHLEPVGRHILPGSTAHVSCSVHVWQGRLQAPAQCRSVAALCLLQASASSCTAD